MSQAAQFPVQQPILMDLSGDREVAWSWLSASLPVGPGTALEVGAAVSKVGTVAAMKGFDITSIVAASVTNPLFLPNMRFVKGAISSLELPEAYFDVIINTALFEQVDLVGNKGLHAGDENVDLHVMTKLRRALKLDGVCLLTLPVGKDINWSPKLRIYGERRLGALINGFKVKSSRYWMKDNFNRWVLVTKERALKQLTSPTFYGIGCFELIRDDSNEAMA